jgi:hypothetical protein
VLSDLQTKLEKYERKAAQYEKAAQQANDGPERAFYQGLARYCDELATKFRSSHRKADWRISGSRMILL